jgi:hypothetical protein
MAPTWTRDYLAVHKISIEAAKRLAAVTDAGKPAKTKRIDAKDRCSVSKPK